MTWITCTMCQQIPCTCRLQYYPLPDTGYCPPIQLPLPEFSLRDRFAAAALTTLMMDSRRYFPSDEVLVQRAFRIADLMLAARASPAGDSK